MESLLARISPSWKTAPALICLSLIFFSAGCEAWKQSDASIALLLVPDVNTVTVDGRDLIRIRMRRSAVWIDQHGGRIVKFNLQPKPRMSWSVSSDEDEHLEPTEIQASQPSVVGALADRESWIAVSRPENPTLDRSMCWVVDGDDGQVVLLSDDVDGLRWRRAYQLSDSGTLRIRVSVQNRGWKERLLEPVSLFEGPADSTDGGHLRRRILMGLDESSNAGRTPASGETASDPAKRRIEFSQTVGPGGRLEWCEEWRIVR